MVKKLPGVPRDRGRHRSLPAIEASDRTCRDSRSLPAVQAELDGGDVRWGGWDNLFNSP
jgi:hypothetical protein